MSWFIVIEKANDDIKVALKTTLGYIESVEWRPERVPFERALELAGPFESRREAETRYPDVFSRYWAMRGKRQEDAAALPVVRLGDASDGLSPGLQVAG